jgi:anti-anti-sigma regulatory factor
MDTAGIRTLVLARRDALSSGATLTVEILRPGPLERIFEIAGLNQWFG